MKYLLHHNAKASVIEDFKYEEILPFQKVGYAKCQMPVQKVDILKQVLTRQRKEEERRRIERDVIREAFEAQIVNMEEYVDESVINQISIACRDESEILML